MKLKIALGLVVSTFLLSWNTWAATDIGFYVVNELSNNVSVINPTSNTVTATISVGTAPQGLIALPDATFVYVANNGSDNVSVIRVSDNTVTATISGVGDGPTSVAATPDSAFVYVTTQDDDSVSVIDTSNNTVVDTIAVGDNPRSIVINEEGTFAYVANMGGGSVSVIDLSDNTVADTIALGAGPTPIRISINHAGTFVYTANFLDSSVSIIDTSDNSVDSEFATGFETLDVSVSSDDSLLYVLSAGNGLEIANASSHAISSTTTLGNFPRHGIFNSDGSKFYVVEYTDSTVGIVNTTTHTRTSGITVGTSPYDIAVVRTVPELTLSRSTVSFSSTQQGQSSATQTVTLTSSGSESVNITSITATSHFSQTNDCGTSLAVGATCTLTLTFSPTTTGDLGGTVTIATNADSSPDVITLSGTATAASSGGSSTGGTSTGGTSGGGTSTRILSLSATSVAFGDVNTSTTSAAQSVTLTNTGNSDLSITSITASGVFAQTNNCSATIAASASCTLQVTFSPTAEGAASGTIRIVSNASTSPDTITLSGTGVAKLRIVVSSDTSSTTAISGAHILNNIFYNVYFAVTSNSPEALGASQLSFSATDDNYYDTPFVSTTFAAALIEYNSTTNANIATYTCTVTNTSTTVHNVSCPDIGAFTTSTTRYFKLLAYSATSYPLFYSSDLNISASTTVGTLSATNTYKLIIADFIYNAHGCTLIPENSASGSGGSGDLLFVILPGLFFLGLRLKMSRMIKVRTGLFLLLSLLIFDDAQASTANYSVNFDTPTLGSSGAIYTLGTENIPSKFQFTMDTTYAHGFMRLSSKKNVVNNLVTHYLGFNYAPNTRLQLDVLVPVISFDELLTAAGYDNKAGIGDVILRGHIRLWENEDASKGLALVPFMSVPTGNENHFVGDKYPRGGVKIAGDWQISDRWYAAANLGLEARQPVQLFNYRQKGRILASTGASYQAFKPFKLTADLILTTAIERPLSDNASTSLEMMGGAVYKLKNHPVTFSLAAGGPIVRSAVTPLVRVQGGLSVAFGGHKDVQPTAEELQSLQPTLFFGKKSFRLEKNNRELLYPVARLLKKYPDMRLVLVENTDVGRGKRRRVASLRRASVVKDYLISQGVSPDRLRTTSLLRGRGTQNRSVELRVDK